MNNHSTPEQWLRGRALDSRLREPRFKSCAVVLKPWASFFTLHCSSSLSCTNEYLAIDNGRYVYEQPSCINCTIWLDASQRSWDGVWVNRSVKEVKCKALWGLDTALYKNLPFLHLRSMNNIHDNYTTLTLYLSWSARSLPRLYRAEILVCSCSLGSFKPVMSIAEQCLYICGANNVYFYLFYFIKFVNILLFYCTFM